jgi:hypothetical protein
MSLIDSLLDIFSCKMSSEEKWSRVENIGEIELTIGRLSEFSRKAVFAARLFTSRLPMQ